MKKICKFGISFLDAVVNGIYDEDLLIIGAESGIGKSTIAEIIAFSCVQQGVKPALFSLENFAGNTRDKKAFELWKKGTKNWTVRFREFIDLYNKDPASMDDYVSEAEKLINQMVLIERTNKDYTIDILAKDFKRVVDEGCKVILLDHLDYFDAYEKDNDLQHTRRLMKEIRRLQDEYKVAVIGFSQLRKNVDKNIKVPTYDDLYGSGDKVKQATLVLMVARTDEEPVNGVYQTYMNLSKDRFGSKVACKIGFDIKTGTYCNIFLPVRVINRGTEVIEDFVSNAPKPSVVNNWK